MYFADREQASEISQRLSLFFYIFPERSFEKRVLLSMV